MFTAATFGFLYELAANNDRAWFDANKARYEVVVREPALEFIAAMRPLLSGFAPNFRAEPRRVGGSLMRVHRDTRFSRDKAPYKTNIGIQFRHVLGRDVHAPGFYLHVSTSECFLGAGCWRPEADALGRIRERVATDPGRWLAARDDRTFRRHWTLAGDSLIRLPRGYALDHPAVEDLKRKDFIALAPLSADDVASRRLLELAGSRYAGAAPLMKFLCESIGVPY